MMEADPLFEKLWMLPIIIVMFICLISCVLSVSHFSQAYWKNETEHRNSLHYKWFLISQYSSVNKVTGLQFPGEVKNFLRIVVFWDVTPCSLVGGYETTWCHNPESHNLNKRFFENIECLGNVLFTTKTRLTLGATQLPVQGVLEIISPGRTHSMKLTTRLHLPKFRTHDVLPLHPLPSLPTRTLLLH
jgi:hypothetical protein